MENQYSLIAKSTMGNVSSIFNSIIFFHALASKNLCPPRCECGTLEAPAAESCVPDWGLRTTMESLRAMETQWLDVAGLPHLESWEGFDL